jgi:hypothetical protein
MTAPGATARARRRDLHRHPEFGFTEFRTPSLVAARLAALGWDVAGGGEVMDLGSRLGVPDDDVLARAADRAADDGADPRWLAALRAAHRRRRHAPGRPSRPDGRRTRRPCRARARRRPARARRARGPQRKSPDACRTRASRPVSAST